MNSKNSGSETRWFFLAVAVLLTALPARAEQKTSLVVHREPGAEDCPDVYKLATQVHTIVGREVIGAGPGEDAAWIEVTMSRDADGYRAIVRTFGPTVGQRELHDTGADCSGLGDAVAVSLALLWTSQQSPFGDEDADGADGEIESGSGDGDAATESPPTEPTREVRPRAKRPKKRISKQPGVSEREVWPGADLFVGATLSVLEHPAPSAELGFRLELGRHVSLGLVAGGVGPDRLELEQGNVDLGLLYAALRACAAILGQSPRLLLCAKPSFGILQGEGQGFDNSFKRQVPYLAIAAGLELRGPIAGSWGWATELEFIAPFERQGFSVSDPSGRRAVFSSPSLGLMALLGVCWDAHP